MVIFKKNIIPSSEITPQKAYLNRRQFMAGIAATAVAAPLAGIALADTPKSGSEKAKISTVPSDLSTHGEKLNSFRDITHYNNFYEFSTAKEEVADLSKDFRTRPWNVTVEGLINKPQTFDLDTLMKLHAQEERIFRHRCVEGWSMVIPWVGYSLSELIKKVEPQSKAKYVQFITLNDPKSFPGQRGGFSAVDLQWPYSEGLRLNEAMHPLATLCFGLYGQELPNQDGAPVRIVVPWKYGFKSAKSIVKIRFVEKQPPTTWNIMASNEYGFYSNVNPKVDHPRWSQAKERRIGEFFKRDTLMFNGYGDQVASLYTGMDLKKNF